MTMDKLWKQITLSDYAWEQEALAFAKAALPDHDPYRAWANFEFITREGFVNEVDLLVLTPKGLFLVEIKSHPGVISGDAGTWVWESPEGKRKAFDNPMLLADRKAKKLASLLQSQDAARKSTKERVPFITPVVFLSAPNVVVKLEANVRQRVCTRQNFIEEITHYDETWRYKKIDKPTAKMLSQAMVQAGIKESLRTRRVGQFELTALLGESDLYQEWLGRHIDTGVTRRVRIYLTYGKPADEAKRLDKAAHLEAQLLEGIDHPGILKTLEFQRHDHGPALIYENLDGAQRLDHWLLKQGEGKRLDKMTAVTLLRTLAETVRYAHRQKLYHRALCPQSIFIKDEGGSFKIKIANWATAQRQFESESRHVTAFSNLNYMVQEESAAYMALESHALAEADGVQLDVFSLGGIAYHIFTGKKPAANELELQDKLRNNGLQVTDELNGASKAVQDLVQFATHPDLGARIESMDDFLQFLEDVENELTRPDHELTQSPTEAKKGQTFEGGYKVLKRLGRGACSVVFLVEYQGQQRVLKMAIDPEHNRRIYQEGEVLSRLRHQSIVAYYKTVDILGHTALLLDYAVKGTLAQRIRHNGAIQLEHLERFGDDLLGALAHLEDKAILHRDIKPDNVGVTEIGSQLHLVLFDFSLVNVSADNIKAGTPAYMDPYLKAHDRRRWDDYAERFSAALTLYEMAAGSLPGWANNVLLPADLNAELHIDPSVFDPSVRSYMSKFFEKAMAKKIADRFSSAQEMLRAWRQLFLQAAKQSKHPSVHGEVPTCPIDEAQKDTQIGLLELTPSALDALSRRNINTVADLLAQNRSHVRAWSGVGVKTRNELSELIRKLQAKWPAESAQDESEPGARATSVDRLLELVFPKTPDANRARFLNEFLGRLDAEAPKGDHNVHWPSISMISSEIGMDVSEARVLQSKVTAQWSKQPDITALRNDIAAWLAENGGVMTAMELADTILLRRGSVEDSPVRERRAQAVVRAAVETELTKQQPRWILRRFGNRYLIADDQQGLGEELATYAQDLGQLASECALKQPLLNPQATIDKVRSVTAPETFVGLSTHRLLRLAAAASEQAALSSRAEFYPRDMEPSQALALAQGALLGSRALTVNEIQARVKGRYPAAKPLPGRPQLDELVRALDLGLDWDPNYEVNQQKVGAYCLPNANLTEFSIIRTPSRVTLQGEIDMAGSQEYKALHQAITNCIDAGRFLALSVSPRYMERAKRKLVEAYGLASISFDELLLRHLHRHLDGMAKPPSWQVVLRADAAEQSSRDWANLQRLVQQVLPAMAEEIKQAEQPVLLTEPGLIARYDLVHSWLNDLRQHLLNAGQVRALVLLIAGDAQQSAPVIDGTIVPLVAGNSQFARVPNEWLPPAIDSEQRIA